MQLVIGATGRAGGETARALIRSGARVRVFLRRQEQAAEWEKLGAEAAFGRIEDVPSLVAAMQGASGAFVIAPPPVSGDPYERADEIGKALAAAVRQARLPSVVALSSIGAQHEDGTGVIAMLHRLERHLDGAAPSITFLRPGYFVETWGEVAPVVVTEGVLPSFLEPARKIPMVSTVDVGRCAAGLLRENHAGRRIVELGGPADWSAEDVAATFAAVLGLAVVPAFVPPDARPGILARDGVPPEVAAALLGMYEGLANGRVSCEDPRRIRRGTVSLAEAVGRIVSDWALEAEGAAATALHTTSHSPRNAETRLP
jgi:uncharacterized protein YbjT (DUF2867 family)